MKYHDKQFCLEVWGDFACFTRPEFKVERVTYDIITPSAARAIFEAILWKPAIKWIINRIEVLSPIRTMNIKRNEVGATAGKTPIYIDQEKVRQQRNAIILRDVRYRIWATLKFIPVKQRPEEVRPSDEKALAKENPGKYNAMFERRASKGQCFNQPYLGCREFSAHFRLIDPTESLTPPINESKDLQYMLYDMDFESSPTCPYPIFFHAQMNNGVIEVPEPDSDKLLK
ncbi:MAG: type I-C CRISPR-associated protein Cas5c [Muribaculaceae bacterium]|nr:type I-C CRISPR-associated protein Cas5c [Muribaculaceae bacterium]